MSEVRNLKYASWYAGACDDQGKALINLLTSRIKQLEDILDNIAHEDECLDEYGHLMVIDSIKTLATNIPDIEEKVGYFIWTTKE
ncbi:hypothetical protein D9M71_580510 [compost metagenome]